MSRLLFILFPFAISLFTLKILGHPCEINYLNLLTYDGVEDSIRRSPFSSQETPKIILPSWEDGTIFFPVKSNKETNPRCKPNEEIACLGSGFLSHYLPLSDCREAYDFEFRPISDS